ncbi:uncharacterized protein BDZ99DRAFT_527313 [Mytilinidion resinicola]|uniref:Uncharacterized protein n=1 Tax=Mytilinidion resinicola TaxID=574789 RepID=A0A6A6Y2Z3_9PEZI|nr:uncharacterized protein BDZ99DRAFT_527313 [Mytilinidion resinicola]KAF2802585.1 hypothetical protein BDZ99DRAFT_527313 [Mytilinidion resinicola]
MATPTYNIHYHFDGVFLGGPNILPHACSGEHSILPPDTEDLPQDDTSPHRPSTQGRRSFISRSPPSAPNQLATWLSSPAVAPFCLFAGLLFAHNRFGVLSLSLGLLHKILDTLPASTQNAVFESVASSPPEQVSSAVCRTASRAVDLHSGNSNRPRSNGSRVAPTFFPWLQFSSNTHTEFVFSVDDIIHHFLWAAFRNQVLARHAIDLSAAHDTFGLVKEGTPLEVFLVPLVRFLLSQLEQEQNKIDVVPQALAPLSLVLPEQAVENTSSSQNIHQEGIAASVRPVNVADIATHTDGNMAAFPSPTHEELHVHKTPSGSLLTLDSKPGKIGRHVGESPQSHEKEPVAAPELSNRDLARAESGPGDAHAEEQGMSQGLQNEGHQTSDSGVQSTASQTIQGSMQPHPNDQVAPTVSLPIAPTPNGDIEAPVTDFSANESIAMDTQSFLAAEQPANQDGPINNVGESASGFQEESENIPGRVYDRPDMTTFQMEDAPPLEAPSPNTALQTSASSSGSDINSANGASYFQPLGVLPQISRGPTLSHPVHTQSRVFEPLVPESSMESTEASVDMMHIDSLSNEEAAYASFLNGLDHLGYPLGFDLEKDTLSRWQDLARYETFRLHLPYEIEPLDSLIEDSGYLILDNPWHRTPAPWENNSSPTNGRVADTNAPKPTNKGKQRATEEEVREQEAASQNRYWGAKVSTYSLSVVPEEQAMISPTPGITQNSYESLETSLQDGRSLRIGSLSTAQLRARNSGNSEAGESSSSNPDFQGLSDQSRFSNDMRASLPDVPIAETLDENKRGAPVERKRDIQKAKTKRIVLTPRLNLGNGQSRTISKKASNFTDETSGLTDDTSGSTDEPSDLDDEDLKGLLASALYGSESQMTQRNTGRNLDIPDDIPELDIEEPVDENEQTTFGANVGDKRKSEWVEDPATDEAQKTKREKLASIAHKRC